MSKRLTSCAHKLSGKQGSMLLFFFSHGLVAAQGQVPCTRRVEFCQGSTEECGEIYAMLIRRQATSLSQARRNVRMWENGAGWKIRWAYGWEVLMAENCWSYVTWESDLERLSVVAGKSDYGERQLVLEESFPDTQTGDFLINNLPIVQARLKPNLVLLLLASTVMSKMHCGTLGYRSLISHERQSV